MTVLAKELRDVREPAAQAVLRLQQLVRTYRQGPRRIDGGGGGTHSGGKFPGVALAADDGQEGLLRFGGGVWLASVIISARPARGFCRSGAGRFPASLA